MNMPVQEEIKRHLSTTYGRSKQSGLTGFVHWHHRDSARTDALPLLENFCFILALFRTHLSDCIQEGMGLLDRILCWQAGRGKEKGGFPRYLHEYPKADPFTAVKILAALFWLQKRYHHILKKPLKNKLQKSLFDLHDYCQRMHQEITYYGGLLSILEAFQSVFFAKNFSFLPKEIQSSEECSEYLMAAQILQTEREWKCIGDQLFAEMSAYWSENLSVYIGPLFKQRQQKFEPAVTLFDYYMGEYYNYFPKRLDSPRVQHLHSSLIFPMEPLLHKVKKIPFDGKWQIHAADSYVMQCLPQKEASFSTDMGFHVFRLLWKEKEHLHSLVCQEKELLTDIQKLDSGNFYMTFHYPKIEAENQMELVFYVDAFRDLSIKIDSMKATAFSIDETLQIQTDSMAIHMDFEVLQGEGKLMGHIMLGNRPAQLDHLSNKEYAAFDWKIGLRTISRSKVFTLRLGLKICCEGSGCLQQVPLHAGHCQHRQ
ncbi:MAG: hypothetical protein Tsb0015_11190 [Simkaniaceae bacterium]